ncbi:Putative ribonuclease H protein At1g65750 [Linum perenne]
MGMTPSDARLGEDAIVWGLEVSGRFSVKTTYWLVKEIAEEDSDTIWKKVWSWEGPAKIKHFIWLVMHGKVITNEERRRRHLSPDAICPECQDPCESMDHILRRCNVAREVWKELLPLAISRNLEDVKFADWWTAGIANKSHNLLFGVTSWLLWLRRNRLVFHNERLSVIEMCGQVKFWTHLYSSSWKALQLSREAPGLARQAQLIGWRPAEEGWFSLNSEGSLVHNPNSAAAGGIIRDWEVSIHHIYREANYAADYLASFGHSLCYGIHVLDAPDRSLLYWRNFDVVGSCTTRLIPNNIM